MFALQSQYLNGLHVCNHKMSNEFVLEKWPLVLFINYTTDGI